MADHHEYFGLRGVALCEDSGPDPGAYVSENRGKWLELEKKHGLQTGRVENERSVGLFPYLIMTLMDLNRQLDLTKMRAAWEYGGKAEEVDTKEAWYTAFDRFRKAKNIP